MQAIEVKNYCDNNGNMKVRAICSAKSKTFYRSDLERRLDKEGIVKNYETISLCAAKILSEELEWNQEKYYGQMIMGTLKNGNDVFVFTGKE